MKAPSVCVQLTTVGIGGGVSVQLVADYDADDGSRRYLLLVNDMPVEVRPVQLHSLTLFRHTVKVQFGHQVSRLSNERWQKRVLPQLCASSSDRTRSAA